MLIPTLLLVAQGAAVALGALPLNVPPEPAVPGPPTNVNVSDITISSINHHTYPASQSPDTDIAVPHPLVSPPSMTTVGLSVGVGFAAASCVGGNLVGCAAAALTSVYLFFFGGFSSSGKRDATSDIVYDHPYPPLPNCGTICRLDSEEPEGDWRPIGNVTPRGVLHNVYYRRVGTLSGLRVVEVPASFPAAVKRAEDDVGGLVVDYHWTNDNQANYDSFHSTSAEISAFADDSAGDLQSGNDILACNAFFDAGGQVNVGLIAVGWNNQPFQFNEDGEYNAIMSECVNDIAHG